MPRSTSIAAHYDAGAEPREPAAAKSRKIEPRTVKVRRDVETIVDSVTRNYPKTMARLAE